MAVGSQQHFWAGAVPAREPERRRPQPRTPLVDEGVIHDLLNPMTSIVGHLHLLEDAMEQGGTGEENQRWLAACRAGVEELSDMLVDLRRLMQAEAGELKPELQPLAVAPLLERVRGLERERAAERRRTVSLDRSAPDLQVHADPALLERALQLVLIAALRLSRSSPILLRAGRAAKGRIRFRCCYEGRPVSPRLAEHLFSRDSAELQQAHGGRIDRARGLVFVRAVAEAHGGAAWCEPNSAGACFGLELPMNN